MVCSVRWSVPAWRYCPDAFAVTRGGYLERRDAAGRENSPFKIATLTCAGLLNKSIFQPEGGRSGMIRGDFTCRKADAV